MIRFLHKICDKRDDFDFDISLMAMSTGYFNLFALPEISSHVGDINSRNKFLTAGLFLTCKAIGIKLRKTFSQFYLRLYELIGRNHVSLKKILQRSINFLIRFCFYYLNASFSRLITSVVEERSVFSSPDHKVSL